MEVCMANGSKTGLSSSFKENNSNIGEDSAMELITSCEMQIKELKEQRKADDRLNAAKDIVKELNSGYTSAINYEKSKIEFLLESIQAIREGKVNEKASV